MKLGYVSIAKLLIHANIVIVNVVRNKISTITFNLV